MTVLHMLELSAIQFKFDLKIREQGSHQPPRMCGMAIVCGSLCGGAAVSAQADPLFWKALVWTQQQALMDGVGFL